MSGAIKITITVEITLAPRAAADAAIHMDVAFIRKDAVATHAAIAIAGAIAASPADDFTPFGELQLQCIGNNAPATRASITFGCITTRTALYASARVRLDIGTVSINAESPHAA